ncbi:hypothetical protein A8V23_01125 [Yersinia pestis]|nr:hypothetical protein [Yersinia pestis]ABX87248.1 hypothetical protein YpAngola_A1450 [Yersinia pestis Angola]AEL74617.1 hypothetical protein A1122_20025 [Yersinia pestis A1122]EDR34576.1 hypothetical protein YPIP275_4827 [Yersinia pestis biovar Orientalis str. IP275]EDR40903.1 hypothetical protein YpF1991016_0458 [Yersinia pestis biovar Orientalis str. F1991016]EDR43492.1 hypothetical protein YpE1979001_2473 [Yersinia pestis biovar Antiqua str. E1979001]EDR51913.1 hypothetical protein YpB4
MPNALKQVNKDIEIIVADIQRRYFIYPFMFREGRSKNRTGGTGAVCGHDQKLINFQ